MTDGNTDTSKEAVESFIQTTMKEAVLSEGMPRTADDTKDVYATVDLLRALAAKLAEVKAERDALRRSLHDETVALGCMKIRAEAAEAQLPRAYRLGMEDGAGVAEYAGAIRHKADGSYASSEPVMGTDVADDILALSTPALAGLQARLKEQNNG